ncbi:hypothetical protein ACFC26_04335 [Kitasatospora purpeofusca]|uniref:hypothetical protein n=1 Tax=Kitasatospora TaxID=2063 RepID=UPI0005BBCCCA|nr:hypothetical protein [Kitasatospora sp. MBT66]
MKKRIDQLTVLVMGVLLLPLQFALAMFHFRMGRAKAARARGDKGAISIELALAIIALVAVAGMVVAALYGLKKKVVDKVNENPQFDGGGAATP